MVLAIRSVGHLAPDRPGRVAVGRASGLYGSMAGQLHAPTRCAQTVPRRTHAHTPRDGAQPVQADRPADTRSVSLVCSSGLCLSSATPLAVHRLRLRHGPARRLPERGRCGWGSSGIQGPKNGCPAVWWTARGQSGGMPTEQKQVQAGGESVQLQVTAWRLVEEAH